MISSTFIGWIITLVFIAILALGFFIGFWRGLKRSVLNIILAIVGVIIAFFVAPSITNAILGINITVDGTQTTLEGAVVELLRSDEDINKLMLANKNLEIFFLNLPRAIINVLIFILLTIAIQLVLYIVYKILALTCVKVKKDENKHRLSGGVVGVIKTFVVMVLAFMPLASLSKVANNLMTQADYGIVSTSEVSESKNGSLLSDKLPDNVENVVVGLENNLLTKMSGMFGLDNAMFDYYSSFQIDKEKLYIRKEVDNLYKIVDFGYQVSKADLNNVNFVKIRYDKVLNAVNDTTNSTLFKKVVAETLADIIINYKDYSFIADSSLAKDYSDVLDNIAVHLGEYDEEGNAYKYFQNDLVEIVNAFKVLGQSGIINEVLELKDDSIENIASIITKEENSYALENAIHRLLDINIIRDGIVTIAQKGIDAISTELDKIGANTEDWTEENWQEFSNSVVEIVDNFGNISSEIDMFKVIEDATILLDENKNYDINLITSSLGTLIDEIRSNKLLKTSENTPIIDDLLEKNNIALPSEPVKQNEEEITIESYSEYFKFITPSLLKLRDEGVYEIINDSSLSSKEMLTNLAEIISEEGNENLLSEIILPLYQVEPTKTIIVDQLKSSLNSDLVDFAGLLTYSDWESDLGYLSDMLITLNSLKIGNETFLSIALDGNVDNVVESLTQEHVEDVLKPILYAKSTSALKDKLFISLKNQIDDVSGANCTLSTQSVTLKKGDAENQVEEICQVVKKLIEVNEALDEGYTIKTIDKTLLGNLLNTMKINAYRKEMLAKTENGIFNNAFVNLMTKLKIEYSKEVQYLESQPDLLAELGVDSLAEENYYKINYNTLLSKLAEAESVLQ